MPADTEALFAAASAAMDKAYAPYSRFPVGAALRGENGRLFAGCNIENASYPEGWCAETSALSAFVMEGGGRITDVCVTARKMRRIMPCGGCRQRLSEFVTSDARLHLCGDGGVEETIAFADIFPRGFDLDQNR